MGDFLNRCVQNGFLSKETTGESQRQDEGKFIDLWNRLSPQQKDSLSTGLLEGLGNTQETEKSNPSQLEQLGNNHKFRPSDFTLEIQKRHHKQPDRDSQTKLIQEYLQAVEEVAKNKELPTEEKLKKLLTPLVNLCNITFPPGYESNLKFIEEDIDLEKELDLKNLISTPRKYTIIEDTELREIGILRVGNKNIYLSERYTDYLSFCKHVKPISEAEFEKIQYEKKYSGQEDQIPLDCAVDVEPFLPHYSVSDIYESWLPTLTQEKMQSNDLLDRILVTYTIKRALNQDEKAINKLFSLFQDRAERVAVKMAKKRGLERYKDDAKSEAVLLLWLMIRGFSAKLILDGLTQNGNFSIPKSVETFYLYWLSQEVPERLSKYPHIQPFDVLVLLNPASPIDSKTRWNDIRMLNSLSFRPSNKTNLCTWLFGTKRSGGMQGRLRQEVSEYLDKYTTDRPYASDLEDYEDKIRRSQVNNQRKYLKRENNPDGNDIDERAMVGGLAPKALDESREFESMINKYEPVLIKHGISERDATITLSCLSEEYTNDELAKQYNLHKSSISKIVSKCKPILKKILQEEI